MGYSRLFIIADDELRRVGPDDDGWTRMSAEIGEATLRLTRDPGYYACEGGRRTTHQLGHTDPGVTYAGEVHSSDLAVFVWVGNRLVNASRASGAELAEARDLLEAFSKGGA
ncbi:MAG: hypothetical protein HKN72_08390 [Gemmatimonadetes bacterium]|nr:hypothetical protein [Gemmatimonadota bacterium]